MRVLAMFVLAITAISAAPKSERIMGGTTTTIDRYPEMVALLRSTASAGHQQECGGVILNNRSVLTSAQCIYGDSPARWQSRVGSSYASSGGLVYGTSEIIINPSYVEKSFDHDIAIIRIVGAFVYSDVVRPGTFTGADYILADDEPVWATGWGSTFLGGFYVEQLRHVQIWTVNQNICRSRYALLETPITDSMLCAGWLDVGGRDQCTGDSGGPLYHNGVVVGVTSFGASCGDPRFPGVNTRVSSYIDWLSSNV